MGPCGFGICSLFIQVEYPLLRCSLFYYIYVPSSFDRARADERYREILENDADRKAERNRTSCRP